MGLCRFLLIGLFCYGCQTEGEESRISIENPIPFFGKLIKEESNTYLLKFDPVSGSICKYDTESNLIMQYMHHSSELFESHLQSFHYLEDSLIVMERHLDNVLIYDHSGLIKAHYWTLDFELNHFSSYRNKPVYDDGAVYVTLIPDCNDLGNADFYEVVIDLQNRQLRKVPLELPPDLDTIPILQSYQFLPNKIGNKNSLLYHYPTSNYLTLLNLNDYSFTHKLIGFNQQIKSKSHNKELNYCELRQSYDDSRSIRIFDYNDRQKTYGFILKNEDSQHSFMVFNNELSQEVYHKKLSDNYLVETLQSWENGFVLAMYDSLKRKYFYETL